jgi:hypothetical protein
MSANFAGASALLLVEAVLSEPATDANVFHAPQDGHCPCHFRQVAPHSLQTKEIWTFDIVGL